MGLEIQTAEGGSLREESEASSPWRWGVWDFREGGLGLRHRLLKVVPCKRSQGHSSLREGGFWILENRAGVCDNRICLPKPYMRADKGFEIQTTEGGPL